MKNPLTLGLVLVVMICFAANSVATRYLVNGRWLDPAAVTITRFTASAFMLAVILAMRGKLSDARPKLADAWLVFFLGGYALAIAYGYGHITAAAGTFVFYALVIVTMAVGGGNQPTLRAGLGALIALAGVAVLALGKVAGTTTLGVALLAFTGATWGAYSLILRKRGAPLATNARAFAGFVLVLPLLAWIERDALIWTTRGVLIALGMGAITTALAYALWAHVLPKLTPIEAGTFQLFVPVMTASLGIVVLDEAFTLRLGVAGALVLAGMWLSTQRAVTRS